MPTCKVLELLHLLGSVLLAAQRLAELIDLHVGLKRRGVGLFSGKGLPEVLGKVMDEVRLAEGKLVVVKLQRSVRRHKLGYERKVKVGGVKSSL